MKKKQIWRKHAQVEEIIAGQEELENQKRTTRKIVRKGLKRLRVDEILQPQSRYEALRNKPFKELSKSEKKEMRVQNKMISRNTEKQIREMLTKPKPSVNKKGAAPALVSGAYDVWADEVPGLETVRVKRKTPLPASVDLEAVSLPHPGQSYNPDAKDHAEVVIAAAYEEVKKDEEKEKYKTKIVVDRRRDYDDYDLKGLMKLLSETVEEEEETNGEVEEGFRKVNVDPVRKTTAQRNRELFLKAKQKISKNVFKSKNRIESIEGLVKHILKKQAKLIAKRNQRKKEMELKPKRLGKHLFQPADIPVKLSDELPEAMRTLKAEGNLFLESFKRLQERNIIEPRVRVGKKRKYKIKFYEKRSFKEFK
ncbi:P60-like domain-containing protein [Rozella allomycis CSF55]|uniref:Ribosome biogenesis protein NOP53 n=1 Tax=Rozella allomycis (strain CSF55) TaxID=988480 RepID=A0A075B2Z7_ROZAC|nr:P60-like domain-containing protein [Rozella allomycis CSF55]|eukprot:EPZ36719.1 P60-like domain-containing protein [Rozella allomycis CSF55]